MQETLLDCGLDAVATGSSSPYSEPKQGFRRVGWIGAGMARLTSVPDARSGRANVAGQGEGFNEEAKENEKAAEVIDKIYGR
ncbi:hypothetical protein OB13_15750 [Pontibacter sp. HJ8]